MLYGWGCTRIVDDCGGAFSMGLVFGSMFNFCKGCFQAPRSMGTRTVLRYGFIRTPPMRPLPGALSTGLIGLGTGPVGEKALWLTSRIHPNGRKACGHPDLFMRSV